MTLLIKGTKGDGEGASFGGITISGEGSGFGAVVGEGGEISTGGGQLQVVKRLQDDCNWGTMNKFYRCELARVLSPSVSQE